MTGSGKTHTMLGQFENRDHIQLQNAYGEEQDCEEETDEQRQNKLMNMGLCNLSIQNLFFQMFQRQEEYTYTVRVSYLEIYNEQVRDLLADLNQYAGTQRVNKTRLKDYI